VAQLQSSAFSSYQKKERSVRLAWVLGLLGLPPNIYAAIIGNSTALIADMLRNAGDLFVSFLSWQSVRKIEAEGKNAVYNYGAGKLENLSSLAVAGVMLLSCIIITYSAISRFIHPQPVAQVGLAIGLKLIGVVINGAIWRRNYRLWRKEPSPILDSQWHLYRGRTLIVASIILSLIVSAGLRQYGWTIYVDPVTSLLLAGFVLVSAYRIASTSIDELLDRTLEEALQLAIVQELTAYFDEYVELHGVRSRRSGNNVYIEIFLEFDGQQKMAEAQSTINRMKASLEQKIQNSEVAIVPTQINQPRVL